MSGHTVDRAFFRPIYESNVTRPISDNLGEEDDLDEVYTMQGYDLKGNTLFVHNFEPAKLDEHDPVKYSKFFTFEEAIPSMRSVVKIALFKGFQPLGTFESKSTSLMPKVKITSPTSNNSWPIDVKQNISWTTDSPVERPIYALVQYSPDDGKSMFTLGRDINGKNLTVDPDQLPGSSKGTIYVQLSDGFRTSSAQSGPIDVASKAPYVHIISPSKNAKIIKSIPLSLVGTAFDTAEALQDNQFIWSSSLDGILGTGPTLTRQNLTAGEHLITLSIKNSQGLVGNDTIKLAVAEPS